MSDLTLSLRTLPTSAGASETHHLAAPVGDDWATPVAHVEAGHELAVDVTLTTIDQGVLAHVRTTAPAAGECVRCLDPVDLTRDIDFYQVYYWPEDRAALIADGDEEAEDAPEIVDDAISLAGPLRDQIVGELPLRPLCEEDCPGLCPDCGEPLRDLEEDHHHEVVDPRWAALAQLLPEADRAGLDA